jgi:hypothetical protein
MIRSVAAAAFIIVSLIAFEIKNVVKCRKSIPDAGFTR